VGGGGGGASGLTSGLFEAECSAGIGFGLEKARLSPTARWTSSSSLSGKSHVDVTSVGMEERAALEFHVLQLLVSSRFIEFLPFLLLL
jgi:hypothetical protein